MDTLVAVDRRTGELLLVAAEPSATNSPVHLTFTKAPTATVELLTGVPEAGMERWVPAAAW